MSDQQIPTDAAIVGAYREGNLLEWIFTGFGYRDRQQLEAVTTACAHLHNTGAIDVLSLIRPDALAPIERRSFFIGKAFYSRLIPRLVAPAKKVVQAVAALVEKGGNDLSAANEPTRAFREWCAADISRSREIIQLAQDGDSLASKVVTFALEAGSMADEALELISHSSPEIRMSAVTALGRMPLNKEASPNTLRSLAGILDKADGEFACNVLLTALSITKRSGAGAETALQIARRVRDSGGSVVHSCFANALSLHGEGIPGDIVEVLLDPLLQVKASEREVVWQLDTALSTLIASEHWDRTVNFARRFFTDHSTELKPSDFPSFGSRLREEPPERLWATLVPWLLSGEPALCMWLTFLLDSPSGEGEPVEIPASALELDDEAKRFLARKIIGYLFLQPVTCAALMVSILSTASGDLADDLLQHIYDPMLINYGGSVRRYLEAVPPIDPVYSRVRDALARADAWVSELLPPGAIKELYPSEHERQTSHQRMSDEMSVAFKKVQSDSVLFSLAKTSVVLYGRRSLTYIAHPGRSRQPVEVDLHPHGVSIEIPYLQIVDPVGLEYMLRVLRAERLRT